MNTPSPTPQAPALPAEVGAPRRITTDREPSFPCWIYHPGTSRWVHFLTEGLTTGDWGKYGWTHWLPDQSTAPTCVPETSWSAFAATVPDELALPTPPPTSTPDTEWAGTFDTLRKSLVECVAYLDRMGQDGVRERAYKALALPMPLIPDASAARTEADLWQRKYEQARLAQLEAALPGVIDDIELLLIGYEGLGGDMMNNGPMRALAAINQLRSLLPSNAPEKPSKGEGV